MKYFKLTTICIFCSLIAFGQGNFKSLLKAGEESYYRGEYNKALVLFFKADSLSRNNMEASYWIGKSYIQLKGKELNAIPFYEHALGMKNVPIDIHKDLGTLYHQTFLFDKAIQQFSLYIKLAGPNDGFVGYCRRMLDAAKNAKLVVGKKVSRDIKQLPLSINNGYAEYAPYISADLSIMIFTRLEIDETDINGSRLIKKFFITHYDGVLWDEPIELRLPQEYDINQIELAGISIDGHLVYLSIGEKASASLYSSEIKNNTFTNIQPLNNNINSQFGEFAIVFSADGTSCIFSSNRIGGYGGTDLYMSVLGSDGEWGIPRNLGSVINTPFNEDNPFLHPGGEKLIFASEGHRSIGGYDLFESFLNENGFWTKPMAIDYANTVYDDRNLMLDAKGQKAVLAQVVNFYPGRSKIYYVDLSDNIPLTMVGGSIKAGHPPKPHHASIKVYDHETKQRIKYVYYPSKYTGRYLMIFPPGRNYDIVIEAEGFLPYLINIHIPEQKYFYELYQEIILESIEDNKKIIGENITIRNTFYDIYKVNNKEETADSKENSLRNYNHLIQFMDDIVQYTDTILSDNIEQMTVKFENRAEDSYYYDKLFDLIGNAIENTDSLSLVLLDQNTLYDDVLTMPTYYKGDIKKNLVASVYNNDTLLTTPPLNMTDSRKITVPERNDTISLAKNKRYIHTETILFELNDASIEQQYFSVLNEIVDIMKENRNIRAELFGYADPQGSVQYNLALSEKRAKAVLEYMSDLGLDDYRFIVIPCGVDRSSLADIQSKDVFKGMRRVEIKVFEIQK